MKASRPGVTLVETAIGVALLGTAVLVLSALFSAGMKAYNYGMRQTLVLYQARRALFGEGWRQGMLPAAMGASTAASLDAAKLDLVCGGSGLQYYSDGSVLLRATAGGALEQAKAATALQVDYYNLDSAGTIIVSTAPASALMATALLQFQTRGQSRNYKFFSGAGMRNHP
ncbi:MAG: hypothetical protein PHU21_01995 [Elusimicrobia bacterium]|nr:hypothetical protein [Elusimicrobiota bacterium]